MTNEYLELTRSESAKMRQSIADHIGRAMACPVCGNTGLQSDGVRVHGALVALVADAYCLCGSFSTRFLVSACNRTLSEQQAMRDELGPHASKRDLVDVLRTQPLADVREVHARAAHERRGPRAGGASTAKRWD